MSALKSRSNSLAGLTLDAVLGGEIVIKPSSPPSPPPLPQEPLVPQRTTTTTTPTQTLFDIIRDEYQKEGQKDRTTWQIFREKLRLKRTGSAWTSSFHIPASDILIPNPKHIAAAFRSQSNGLVYPIPMSDPPPGSAGRGMFTRGSSMRVGSGKNAESNFADVSIPGDGPPSSSFKPQLSRHDSVRDHGDGDDDKIRRHPVVKFVDERQMSAREAVAAQEAAEAEAAADASDDDEEEEEGDGSGDAEEEEEAFSAPKQTMSLMDLLEETDRQMGLTGARYAMDDEEDEYEEEEEEEEEEDDGHGGGGEGEASCCVCQVRIKGAASTPCGHTFCKLCSKELMAQKGHCPVCSTFVLEFLDIF
ncbi:hypothetical protein HA466_0150840 [Hirschfeldia incana]|nr:hypothetical protein HA466_0150840 [Hirschfeldia incana]